MRPKNNLAGQRFGRLTAIKDSGKRKYTYAVWECVCDCGKKMFVISRSLRGGDTRSCGCLIKETNIKGKTGNKYRFKHGDDCKGSVSKLYSVWIGMKNRCFHFKNSAFKYYGARGISVCSKWKNNYLAFKDWALSHGYQPRLTIDRINNDGNYEPGNCQFITKSENSRKATSKRWEDKKNRVIGK